MAVRRGRARVSTVVAAAMCVVAALPGWVSAAEPNPYEFAQGARQVKGAPSSTEATTVLQAGATYRSSIGPDDDKLYYRVSLDAESAAYVSAVVVPQLGTKVAYGDGLSARLLDDRGRNCGRGSGTAGFRSADYPRPIVASAERLVRSGGTWCQEAGTYDFVIERKGAADSGGEPWELELTFAEEPPLKSGGEATRAPETWNSAPAEPPVGTARERAGGTSFHTAADLASGVWKDRVKPGQTRFYRVPVDWGQRLSAEATLAGTTGGSGSVSSALHLTLHNPARSEVTSDGTLFRGDPAPAVLDPLPSVAYENRYGSLGRVREMRSPGWYYLKVSLNPALRERYGDQGLGVTLRVGVDGQAKSGIEYAGDPGVFQVGAGGRAGPGGTSGPAYDRGTMRVVAVAGIGTGSALVLGLGVWTLVARRRAGDGPPRAW
ncbi:hypothetical protein U9R90_17315 [Streptomyces sp. E11-3]|uniref:hypothetical protein n=1 Tax=Streptomyces sp. E11-3 TaxID=3110112 RepID=UPI00397EA966